MKENIKMTLCDPKISTNVKTNHNMSQHCFWLLVVASLVGICAFIYLLITTINLHQQLNDTRKIYVYDLQETLRGLKVDELNAQFEAKVNILNHEVLSAQNKISSLKDANIQADFSDVYLNSLKNKRDNMINDYNDTLQKITEQINQNLVNVAQEFNAPTIFNKQAISAFTPNVIDVTPIIVQRIQLDNVNDMLKY